MTGGTDSKPWRSPTNAKQALAALAVVGLVVISLAPAVGVAFADGGSAVNALPTTDVPGSNPPNETAEETTTHEVTLPVERPTETSTGDSSTTERDRTTTAETTDAGDPGNGRGDDRATPPDEESPDRGSDETSRSPGPPGGDEQSDDPGPPDESGPPTESGPSDEPGPPDESGPSDGDGPPGSDDSSATERPPGLGGPPDLTDPGATDPPGRADGGQTPPAGPPDREETPDSGPPVDRPGRPDGERDAPGNRSFADDRTVPGNRTVFENRTLPGNATRPENRTRFENATERGPPVRPGEAPSVNVTVENASANESVAVNVSTTPDQSRNVSFSTVEVTPTRNASFTLNVTASDRPIAEKTPTDRLSNGTEPLAFLSVGHSLPDRNISSVNFTFRLRRDRVNASERGDIALYRYHDESWNQLPTTLVETTANHYVYRVRSPGLSEFAAGKKRPQFEITNATVDLSALSIGDALKVQVRISNEGDADGTFTARLVLGDQSVASRQLTIAAGGMRQTTFERTVAEPGTYEVYVNDFRVGDVAVNETAAAAVTDDRSDDETTAGATDSGGTTDDRSDEETTAEAPGLGVAVVALVGSLAVARWWD